MIFTLEEYKEEIERLPSARRKLFSTQTEEDLECLFYDIEDLFTSSFVFIYHYFLSTHKPSKFKKAAVKQAYYMLLDRDREMAQIMKNNGTSSFSIPGYSTSNMGYVMNVYPEVYNELLPILVLTGKVRQGGL